MARLNVSNSTVPNTCDKPTKQASSPSKKITRSGLSQVLPKEENHRSLLSCRDERGISTQLRSQQKSAAARVRTESHGKATRLTSKAKAKTATDFDIFEDEESPAEDNKVHEDNSISHPRNTKTKRPLRLTHVNSITSSLSRVSKQKPVRTEDTEDEDDKENRLVDEEAEEVADEDEEEQHSDEELGAESDGHAEQVEFESPKFATRGTKTPRRNANEQKFSRYRELQEESQGSDTEPASEEDDGFDSLESFIVSDSEDISYHGSLDGLPDDDDDNLETGTPSPKPTRRRLIRGRRPSHHVAHSNDRGNRDIDPFQHSGREPSCRKSVSESPPMRDLNSKFTRLFPNDRREEEEITNSNGDSDIQQSASHVSRSSRSDSPTKKQTENKLVTPPSTPSKVLLPSPSKTKGRIPPSPHRESTDAFWSQEVTNDWNDIFSPRKEARTPGRALQRLLRALGEDVVGDEEDDLPCPATDSKGSKSPSKTALKKAEAAKKKAILEAKKSFDNKKAGLAEEFLKHLDDKASGGQVQKMAKETGGIKLVWSKTLNTTAGRANWKRVKMERRGSNDEVKIQHHASIELAEKIIDSEDRLLNTLAHEYCHLANFMISGIRDNPHGASFKEWGRKCMAALKDHPVYGGRVEITTKHSYKIDYKYVWICVDCGYEYGRHSKSIDPTKARCGRCKGLLQQIKPKPRNVSPKKKSNNGSGSESSVSSQKIDDVTRSVGKVSLGD